VQRRPWNLSQSASASAWDAGSGPSGRTRGMQRMLRSPLMHAVMPSVTDEKQEQPK